MLFFGIKVYAIGRHLMRAEWRACCRYILSPPSAPGDGPRHAAGGEILLISEAARHTKPGSAGGVDAHFE